MSQDEWDNLKPGDIVIERRSKTPRLVLGVHRRPWRCPPRVSTSPEHVTIELRKLIGGTHACPTTTLDPSMWRRRLDVAHGKHGRIRKEWFRCSIHGWWHVHKRGVLVPVWCVGMTVPPPKPDWSAYPGAR